MLMYRLLTPLALLGSVAAHAQFMAGGHAVFPDGPARHEVEAALIYVDVDPPCSLAVDIGVDRAGKVVSAEVDAKTCTCPDADVQAQAVKAVRERVFNAVKDAPAVQRGRVTWEYQEPEREIFGMIDAVPPPPPPPPADENTVHVVVEENAQFPGGPEAMVTYLSKTLRWPPEEAEVVGKVFVEFIVEKDGAIAEVMLKRGLSPGLDKEAVRAVKSMPKWKPALNGGKPVRSRVIIPVSFLR
jgi:TonB family protein